MATIRRIAVLAGAEHMFDASHETISEVNPQEIGGATLAAANEGVLPVSPEVLRSAETEIQSSEI